VKHADWAANREFKGAIDELVILDRPATVDEVFLLGQQSVEISLAVSRKNKLATTWGKVKSRY
jgi:hypothetical protein